MPTVDPDEPCYKYFILVWEYDLSQDTNAIIVFIEQITFRMINEDSFCKLCYEDKLIKK